MPTSASTVMSFLRGRYWLIPQLRVSQSPGVRLKSSFFPHVSYVKAVTTAVALLAIGYHAIEPCTCCSQKPYPDVVDGHGTTDTMQSACLCVVLADRGGESVSDPKVPMRERPIQPDRF